jgi:hypothetical protein
MDTSNFKFPLFGKIMANKLNYITPRWAQVHLHIIASPERASLNRSLITFFFQIPWDWKLEAAPTRPALTSASFWSGSSPTPITGILDFEDQLGLMLWPLGASLILRIQSLITSSRRLDDSCPQHNSRAKKATTKRVHKIFIVFVDF